MPELAGQVASKALGNFVVFDCNWTALEVFLNCTNQWRLSPAGDIQSLDYSSVRAVMEMMGIKQKRQRDTFERVRLIESGAIPALRKMRERT